MSDARYPLVRAHFNGVSKPIACQVSPESSPLIAISNYLNLQVGPECKDLPPYAEESMLSKPIVTALERFKSCVAKLPRFLNPPNKERLLQIVPSLAKGLHLSPGCRRCQDFIACDELYLFYVLNIKVIHGWVCDPNDKEFFSVLGNCSRSTLLKSISRPGGLAKLVEGTSNPSSLSKKIQKFAESGLTKYGLRILHEEIGERQLAIICINDQFDVIYKCSGDLFVLETDGHVLTKFGEALWKRLTLMEEESFYVTMHFDPVKGQKNIHKATEWLERKLSELDECGDKGKKKKKTPINIVKKVEEEIEVPKSATSASGGIKQKEEVPEPETSGHDPSISHASPPEKEDEEAKPPTIADRFLVFLSEFQVGGSAPLYEGVVAGMKSINLFMLHVPFSFIQQYDGELAIEIQDGYPSMKNELRQSVISYLVNHGFDKKDATVHAQLEIIALPEPKSIQKFISFVEDNEMVRPYELYNNTWDNATTPAARSMGLGYINHMFDKFDMGKCWGKGDNEWDVRNMEVRSNGKEFVINKEADEEATQDLVVHNLLKLFQIIHPRFQGKTVNRLPVFFDSLHADILSAPDPKGDRQTWNRYAKMMRSALALKAPLVRSGLVTNVYRVLSLRLLLEPSNLFALTKKLRDDWRSSARTLEPFLQVYSYRNDVSDQFARDKWENSHWDVVKYSRHFIEHVLLYLKSKSLLHDIAIVEMMISRCLERHIARSIRAIVMEYGVEGMLSTAWGCFEGSECMTMPLQILSQVSIDAVAKEGENEEDVISSEERLVIHVCGSKSGGLMVYSELGRTYNPSDDLASEESNGLPAAPIVRNLSLAGLKDFLEQKGFKVKSSSDGLQREEYILVAKIVRPEERSNRDAPEVRVEGVFSDEYQALFLNVSMWLSSSDNQRSET